MNKSIRISIRNLVEFILRSGSIDNRYMGSVKAVEGIRGHQRVQKSYGDNYTAEVPLKYNLCYEGLDIVVEGRADGILIEQDKVIIDEIKTTTKDLLLIEEDSYPLHWAQAKCYGYIYCVQNNLDEIDIQITYYNIESKTTRMLRKTYSLIELDKFFFMLIKEYKQWAKLESDWIEIRNNTIKKLKFPFESYRLGQRELAVSVYKSIVDSKKCFAQAPTGTGKTISTLFPAIKAIGEEQTSKIFYLTAKTITREVAQNSIKLMKKQNLKLKAVTLTAKDKICKMEETNCNPEYCKYANGYFDRINDSLKDILSKYDDYDRESIDRISDEYELCPFELSLDLTMHSDVIICDYNYVFDPRVYLKRFFDTKTTDFTFLIDESHNLVDRAREMYSASISEEKFSKIKNIIGQKDKRLDNVLNNIENYFINKFKELKKYNQNSSVEEIYPMNLCEDLTMFIKLMDEYLANNNEENEEVRDLYFDVYSFLSISELYDENYVTVFSDNYFGIDVKLYCVNPSTAITERMKKSKSTIIFSATLIPMNYFKEMYGYVENDFILNLKSPFDVNNRLLIIADNIATTYNKRKETSEEIVEYIVNCVNSKTGNYMVFFPSYNYMELVYEKMREKYSTISTTIQESNMTEQQKEEFLSIFNEDNKETHIGFCVLGGHFSEGIDLVNDKLIGVIIVGVGMPQIGIDRDIIKNHMNKENKGFDYAYVYPGMIKVLQAAGRCIRTDEDKGIIMLLDNRYSSRRYQSLFPYEWYPNNRARNSEDVKLLCNEFWSKYY